MPPRQLHLFAPPKPLLQRFGADFFRAAPRRPGVYIMTDQAENVLYIGQSRNLRVRLSTYKNARADRVPRKIVRLVHAVKNISWEECESAEAARLRENRLLRTHRPKFNTLNTYPKAHGFIALRFTDRQLEISRTTELRSGEHLYGAFKSRSVSGYAALLRLLWAALHRPSSPWDFPAQLLQSRPPRQFTFALDRAPPDLPAAVLFEALRLFLAGVSPELVDLFTKALSTAGEVSLFQQHMQVHDLETLTEFFLCGPKRNYDLRQRHGITGQVIAQEELDDLLVI